MNAPTLAKIMCQVRGNDHYDTDYAPCSECREMAEAILVKEVSQPEKLGLIGREAVLIENLAKSIHLSVRKGHEHTPLRETADRRGQWFDVRLADRRVARVTCNDDCYHASLPDHELHCPAQIEHLLKTDPTDG